MAKADAELGRARTASRPARVKHFETLGLGICWLSPCVFWPDENRPIDGSNPVSTPQKPP